MARSIRAGPYTPTRGQFKDQTFASYRQYRNALAQSQGFGSLSARQRAARPITAAAAYEGLNAKEHDSYRRSREALRLLRDGDARNLPEAARMAGTTPNTVQKYAGSALETRGNRIRARDTDSLIRPMKVATTEGVLSLPLESLRDARLVARHSSAIGYYLGSSNREKARRKLRSFSGAYVTVDGTRYYLLTDPAAITALAPTGELDFDSIYED